MIEDQFGAKWRIRAYLFGVQVSLRTYAFLGRFLPEQFRSTDVTPA